MKMELEVQAFMAIPPNNQVMIDQSSGYLKQYIFYVPYVSVMNMINEPPVDVETTLSFPDGYERLYKWDDDKQKWNLHDGKGAKTLKFPVPVLKGNT